MAETETELTLDQQHAQLIAKDWPTMAPVMGDDIELVDKLQRLCESFAELLAYTGRLPDHLVSEIDRAKLAALAALAAQVEENAAYTAAGRDAAVQVADGVSQMQDLTGLFMQSLSDSAASNRAEIADWIAEIEQVADLAQAAAAGDVINNFTVSSLTAWGSARTSEYARQQAVAMAMVLG